MTAPWITEPGVYDIDDAAYLADPVVGGSASSTLLKAMLPPSCPAKAKHHRDHGRPPKQHYDIGSAAHAVILGAGRELAVWEGESWRLKDAAAFRRAERAAGRIPLLATEAAHVRGMREALLRHPQAGVLLAPGSFTAEQTVVWRDWESGVTCRAKYDAVQHYERGGRLVIVDYKSARAADSYSVSKAIADYGYDTSGAHYRNGGIALGLGGGDTEFVLIFQEKEPPYVIHVGRLVGPALRRGETKVRAALDLYAQCLAADRWPGYSDDEIADFDIPTWADRAFERDLDAGLFATSGDVL